MGRKRQVAEGPGSALDEEVAPVPPMTMMQALSPLQSLLVAPMQQPAHQPGQVLVMCSIHSKKRSLQSVEPDGMGGFKCKEGFNCKDGSQRAAAAAAAGMACTPSWQSMPVNPGAVPVPPGPVTSPLPFGMVAGASQMEPPQGQPALAAAACGGGKASKCKGGSKGKSKDKSKDMEPGDWICAYCGDWQFARNVACRKCGQERKEAQTSEEGAALANLMAAYPVEALEGLQNNPGMTAMIAQAQFQALAAAQPTASVRPEVQELCEHFRIDERQMLELSCLIEKRIETWEDDLFGLWTHLRNAHNPGGMLRSKMQEMKTGQFVGRVKPAPDVAHLVKKFKLDDMCSHKIAEVLQLKIPEDKRKEVIEQLDKILESSNKPSSRAMMLLKDMRDGKPLGPPPPPAPGSYADIQDQKRTERSRSRRSQKRQRASPSRDRDGAAHHRRADCNRSDSRGRDTRANRSSYASDDRGQRRADFDRDDIRGSGGRDDRSNYALDDRGNRRGPPDRRDDRGSSSRADRNSYEREDRRYHGGGSDNCDTRGGRADRSSYASDDRGQRRGDTDRDGSSGRLDRNNSDRRSYASDDRGRRYDDSDRGDARNGSSRADRDTYRQDDRRRGRGEYDRGDSRGR
eukprot:TRINITY_DN25661_c0_g1_i1.p1 TRINITY_DN25661_c0_g1~~TRINITY_DN25661_c0_g1_i1.p1  ORF type:complete len:639 (+),score=114.81 TRINITY_DN25661_c0_g1_i1:31-1917(+)